MKSAIWMTAIVAFGMARGTPVEAQVSRTPPPIGSRAGQQTPAPSPRPEAEGPQDPSSAPGEARPEKTPDWKLATFGSGCFWCTEAVFERVKGVDGVISGFSGGQVPNPTYKQVLTGLTGHAEVIHLRYDPAVISYPELLEIFWRTHDPTTLNRQGPDFGTQYRSVVFYHDDEQKRDAEYYRAKLDASGLYNAPIVTEISPFTVFYPAEKYHQDYFRRNPRAAYCQAYITPKIQKFKKVFAEKVKK